MIQLAQSDPDQTVTLIKFLHGGGVIGYIILALSVTAMAFAVYLGISLSRAALMPAAAVASVRRLVEQGALAQALAFAQDPANACYAMRVLAPGIERRMRGALGIYEARGAMEEAGEAETARLLRSIEPLAVIASVAPLLGLLGTVWGMIGAFDTVASSATRDATYHEQLAYNIHIALITTLQGLVVAIPCVVATTFFRSKVDAAAGDLGHAIEPIVLALESGAKPA